MDQCATLRARPQRGRCAQGLEGRIVYPAGEANSQPQDGTVLAHLVEILSKEQLMTTITKKVSLHHVLLTHLLQPTKPVQYRANVIKVRIIITTFHICTAVMQKKCLANAFRFCNFSKSVSWCSCQRVWTHGALQQRTMEPPSAWSGRCSRITS